MSHTLGPVASGNMKYRTILDSLAELAKDAKKPTHGKSKERKPLTELLPFSCYSKRSQQQSKALPFSRRECRVGELPSLRGSSFEFGEGIPNSWLDGFRRAKPSPLREAQSARRTADDLVRSTTKHLVLANTNSCLRSLPGNFFLCVFAPP